MKSMSNTIVKFLLMGSPYNFEETVTVPADGGGTNFVDIRTQKGLIRSKSNPEVRNDKRCAFF